MSIFDNFLKREDEILDRIIEAVETGYESMRRPNDEPVKKNSFSPSSIGYMHNRCPRLWAMKFSGDYYEKDTASLQSLGVMNGGTAAHERIQSALEAAGVVKELEKEITFKDPPIRGFADVIAELDGTPVVVEIKTTRSEAFQSRSLSMKGPAYQMYQLLIYMYIENIENGILLYENNNDKRLLAVPVKLTDENREAVEKVFEWMRKVWSASQEGLLPNRPWKQTSPNCKGCPMFDACWSEPREEIKIRSMAVHAW